MTKTRWNAHNELNVEQILRIVAQHGTIGRHKFKSCNANINKKIRKLVREGVLRVVRNDTSFAYYGFASDAERAKWERTRSESECASSSK